MPKLERLTIRDDAPSIRDRAVSAWRSFWGPTMSSRNPALGSLWGHASVSAGVSVTTQTALGVSALWCACTTLAQDAASLPLHFYRRLPDGGKERYTAHPLYRLLHDQANPETTSYQWRAAMMMSATLHGNGYSEIVRDSGGRPVSLWFLSPDRVSLYRASDLAPLQYRVSNASGGGDALLDAADVIHLKGPSLDGQQGLDVINTARETLGRAIAANEYESRFFSNGAQPGGIVTLNGQPSELAMKNLRESLMSRHEGVSKAHKWLLMAGGATFTPVAISPRDSQLSDLTLQAVQDIARFYRMPPSKLMDQSHSTYANESSNQIAYYTNALRPWLVNFEAELSSKLIAASEKNFQAIEFAAEGILRGNPAERAQFYSVMAAHGLMTANEIRALESLPPMAGGDVLRAPMNTAPLASMPAPTDTNTATTLHAMRQDDEDDDVLIERRDRATLDDDGATARAVAEDMRALDVMKARRSPCDRCPAEAVSVTHDERGRRMVLCIPCAASHARAHRDRAEQEMRASRAREQRRQLDAALPRLAHTRRRLTQVLAS